jgi:hypothetical protein
VIRGSSLRNIRNRSLIRFPTPVARVALLSLISCVGHGLVVGVRRRVPGNVVLTVLLGNELR